MSINQISLNTCIQLVAGIIVQTIEDLSSEDKQIEREANEYFFSEDFEDYCTSLRVHPEYLRKEIQRNKGVSIVSLLKDVSESRDLKEASLPWGALKKISDIDLKKYRSTYRKNRAKKLTLVKLSCADS